MFCVKVTFVSWDLLSRKLCWVAFNGSLHDWSGGCGVGHVLGLVDCAWWLGLTYGGV